MRVSLAVNTLSNVVSKEMEENENNATTSTQEYIINCSMLFDILNSVTPFTNDKDERIKQLLNINHSFMIAKMTFSSNAF